jgi:GTP-binding protein EngB required for normal cell division
VYFADLPGYGYARGAPRPVDRLRVPRKGEGRQAHGGVSVPKAGRESVEELRGIAEAYFRGEQPIAGVLHLVDSRHPGLEPDLNAARWLQTLPVERALAATKIDKLTRAERVRNLRELERQLGMAALPVSATSGEGLDDLWTLIARLAR